MYVKRLKLPKRELIDEIDKERLTKLWNQGYSASEIGREFGLCGTTIIRITRKMQLKERRIKKSTKQAYTFASEPNQEVPISTVPIPAEKTRNIINRFIVPPTLKQLEKQKLQAEIVKAERDYKIYKRDCGFTALQDGSE